MFREQLSVQIVKYFQGILTWKFQIANEALSLLLLLGEFSGCFVQYVEVEAFFLSQGKFQGC